MTLKMFCLYDLKTGIYGTPFFMSHTAQAIRAVQDLAKDFSTIVARHPADYMLYCLGTYDDQVGGFYPEQEPLGTVVSFIPKQTAEHLLAPLNEEIA
jgi:hypothetical protein